jgi:hypothetical protein
MDLETFWYEFSPYIYLVAGAISIFFSRALVGSIAGGLLIVAALTILRLRWVHRREQDKKVKKVG